MYIIIKTRLSVNLGAGYSFFKYSNITPRANILLGFPRLLTVMYSRGIYYSVLLAVGFKRFDLYKRLKS
jgi:hypothetical protein